LDALTELEHPSLKLQDSQFTLAEAHHLMCLKFYDFQPVTQNPWEFYEHSLNTANKLAFKGIKLEFGKVHNISQQDFIQKLT
jgi:hypothetical protein